MKVLCNIEIANIKMSMDNKVAEYTAMVAEKYEHGGQLVTHRDTGGLQLVVLALNGRYITGGVGKVLVVFVQHILPVLRSNWDHLVNTGQ